MNIEEHHARTIAKVTDLFRDNPAFPALIVGGSIVKGLARPDSDVDLILVATDEEYEKRRAAGQLQYFTRELCDYEGGYVDGKVVNLQFLKDAAERGSEPARSAFVDAYLGYSRIPGLKDLITRIAVYQESERRTKIESFLSQVMLLKWFVGEAEKRSQLYLMTQVVSNLVLFAGRIVLAHNRILFPAHKWFITLVEKAPEKPEGFVKMTEDVLRQPCQATADRLHDAVVNWQQWNWPFDRAVQRYMEDIEWTWRTGRPSLQEW